MQTINLRELFSKIYIRGNGIEIGALYRPLPVSSQAKVTYVDQYSTEKLRVHFPELGSTPLIPVDIVDDGQTLTRFADESQDFVIANHFLEHCLNPFATLLRFMAVLKPQGACFISLPDKRFTFDAPRPLTSIEHMLTDYYNPSQSAIVHYREIAVYVDKASDETQIEQLIERSIASQRSIHYHTFTNDSFRQFIDTFIGHFHQQIEIEAYVRNTPEEVVLVFHKAV